MTRALVGEIARRDREVAQRIRRAAREWVPAWRGPPRQPRSAATRSRSLRTRGNLGDESHRRAPSLGGMNQPLLCAAMNHTISGRLQVQHRVLYAHDGQPSQPVLG